MKTVIIDCGHGGIDYRGSYRTFPNKMYKHKTGEVAYEGMYNRLIGKELSKYLLQDYDIFWTVSPDVPIDLSLHKRVQIANLFNSSDSILISLHSNASSTHTARGFEVFTSIGETKSDKLATYVLNTIETVFPYTIIRNDYTDGDIDKESQFYILRKTKCPAILLENLFFDNYEDFKLLEDSMFRNNLAKAIYLGIKKYFEDGN